MLTASRGASTDASLQDAREPKERGMEAAQTSAWITGVRCLITFVKRRRSVEHDEQ
jgi:hypothetical protein